MKTRMEISAGGVIYRRRGGRSEVGLITTRRGETWQLPKGLIEPGEQAEEAARREVAEETGLRGVMLQPLDKIEYWYIQEYGRERARVHKFVYFFLFRYEGGSTADHDHEVDDARWFPLDEALERVEYENERRVLHLAADAIAASTGDGG